MELNNLLLLRTHSDTRCTSSSVQMHIEQSLWLTGRAAGLWYRPVSIANLWQLTCIRAFRCLLGSFQAGMFLQQFVCSQFIATIIPLLTSRRVELAIPVLYKLVTKLLHDFIHMMCSITTAET